MVAGGRELIDTLWNVNMIGTLSPDMGHTELIDTLWNVNGLRRCRGYLIQFELIDTLWNVNDESASSTKGVQGMN